MKTLTQKQVDFYREQGYLNARGTIPQSALELARRVAGGWVEQTIASWEERGLLEDTRPDLDLEHRLVQVWQTAGRPGYIRSPRRDLVGPEMFEFLHHPAILDVAQDLLGTSEISAHGVFNARPKLPDQTWTNTPWHQDAQYFPDSEHGHVVAIWIPLQPVTEHNSCLQVAPQLHRGKLFETVQDEESGFVGLSRAEREKLDGVSVEMETGDALCFPQLTPHRATSNQSDAVRWSMDVRYEATPTATEGGKPQGFVARSAADPSSVTSYEEWLQKWEDIPAGSY